ncbi:MAG: hypothetical protein ACR2G2_06795, partial [Pseudonocardia sp.]
RPSPHTKAPPLPPALSRGAHPPSPTTGSTGRALTVSDLAVIPVGVEQALESDNAAGLMIYLDPLDAVAAALTGTRPPRARLPTVTLVFERRCGCCRVAGRAGAAG